METNKIPLLSQTKRLFSFAEIPTQSQSLQQWQEDIRCIEAGLDINVSINTPTTLLLNVADLKTASEMAQEHNIEPHIKKGLLKYMKVVEQAAKPQKQINLTVTPLPPPKTNSKQKSLTSSIVYNRSPTPNKKSISLSKNRKYTSKSPRMSTIFHNIKLEEKKQKIAQSRYVINKRNTLNKRETKCTLMRTHSRKKSEESLSEIAFEEGKYKKGEILKKTLENTHLFMDMLKLVEKQ